MTVLAAQGVAVTGQAAQVVGMVEVQGKQGTVQTHRSGSAGLDRLHCSQDSPKGHHRMRCNAGRGSRAHLDWQCILQQQCSPGITLVATAAVAVVVVVVETSVAATKEVAAAWDWEVPARVMAVVEELAANQTAHLVARLEAVGKGREVGKVTGAEVKVAAVEAMA